VKKDKYKEAKRSRNTTHLPTRASSSESSASSSPKKVKKEAKGSKAVKPLKVPAKSPATTPSKANDEKEVNRKQFEANAMALRKAFDEDEPIDLPKFEDTTSLRPTSKKWLTWRRCQVTPLCAKKTRYRWARTRRTGSAGSS
jgi:hypothetical protein